MGAQEERLRLTFDQLVHAYPPWRYADIGADAGMPVIPLSYWVMELKFNEAVPRWIRDVVIAHRLVPRRFSKYAAGIDALRHPRAFRADSLRLETPANMP